MRVGEHGEVPPGTGRRPASPRCPRTRTIAPYRTGFSRARSPRYTGSIRARLPEGIRISRGVFDQSLDDHGLTSFKSVMVFVYTRLSAREAGQSIPARLMAAVDGGGGLRIVWDAAREGDAVFRAVSLRSCPRAPGSGRICSRIRRFSFGKRKRFAKCAPCR